MAEQKATNITWHEGKVTPEERQKNMGQKGCTLWMTGLSGSGKSTVAVALEQVLMQRGKHAYRLDGDNIRMGLNKNLGFSAEDRDENIRRIGEVTKLFADAGIISITSFISPYRAARDMVRELHESANIPFWKSTSTVPWKRPRSVTPRVCTRRPAPAKSKASPVSTTRSKRPRNLKSSSRRTN